MRTRELRRQSAALWLRSLLLSTAVLALPAPSTLCGEQLALRVVDESGHAVSGAQVSAWHVAGDNEDLWFELDGGMEAPSWAIFPALLKARDTANAPPNHDAQTDENGLVTIECAEAAMGHVVRAISADRSSGVVRLNVLRPTASTPGSDQAADGPFEIVVRPCGVLHGCVRDSLGSPLEGAAVTVGLSASSLGPIRPVKPKSITTRSDGTFRFAVDAPFGGLVMATDGTQSSGIVITFVGSGEVRAIDLTLGGAYRLAGRVSSTSKDVPLETKACSVMIDAELGSIPVTGLVIEALDDDGLFEAALPRPGRYTVSVSCPGLVQSKTSPVLLTEDEPTAEIEVSMIRPGVITGRAVHADGSPVMQAMVHAVIVEADETSSTSVTVPSFAFTDSDGNFEMHDLVRGVQYRVTVDCGGGSSSSAVCRVQGRERVNLTCGG